MTITTAGDEVQMLREKLRGHDCAGGPNECGDCCTCREAQAHHAISVLADENGRLRRHRTMLIATFAPVAISWLAWNVCVAIGWLP